MSQTNPYQPINQPTSTTPVSYSDIRKVKIRPIELLKRGNDFISGQYWLFFGIVLVGMLISSAVPFGIIMGPMLVGIYLCFLARERGEVVEFPKLFQGFDFFKESFIATLVMIAATFVLIIPLMLILLIAMFFFMTPQQNGGNGDAPPIALFVLMFSFYAVVIFANMLVVLPFLFTFQLIAERHLPGIEAVKLSFQGARRNLFGLIGYVIVTSIMSVILAMMCYIPLFFFMPVLFASLFVLYRDIYPHPTGERL